MNRLFNFLRHEIPLYLNAKNKKSLSKQIYEIYSIGNEYKCIPYHYLTLRLYSKVTTSNYLDYLPKDILNNYRDKLNSQGQHEFAENKKLFAEIMHKNNIDIVKTLYILKKNNDIVDSHGNFLDYDSFYSNLNNDNLIEIFTKPNIATHGNGAERIKIYSEYLDIGGNKVKKNQLIKYLLSNKRSDYYLVQPVIKQHKIINSINSASVNTVRIDTLVTDNDIVHNGAVLRVGNGNSCTDNFSNGGLHIGIDLESGLLSQYGSTKTKYGVSITDVHPTTGTKFSGIKIPYWDDIKILTKTAAKVLDPIKALGWDVAITPSGPIIIETNSRYELFLFQDAVGGLRYSPLGIHMFNSLL